MKICFAASECVPYIKTGGLADVVGALPKTLSKLGCEIKLFLPFYKAIDAKQHSLVLVPNLQDVPIKIGENTIQFSVYSGKLPNSKAIVYFIDCPQYFGRDQIYTDEPDEAERFILFQHAIFEVMLRLNWTPDIIHCNDWQTGLMPALMKLNFSLNKQFNKSASLFSIHNIGYPGKFTKDSVSKANLPMDQYYPGGPLEFYDGLSFLKTGLVYADAISTVSKTYATEIQSPAFGGGMDGILTDRKHDLFGILNGIDTEDWSPQKDQLIPHNYSFKNVSDKKKNKQALLKHAKLKFDEKIPVVGIISRLAQQKGLDLVQACFEEMMKFQVQVVVLGNGDKKLETFFKSAAQKYKDRFFAYIGFDNELAHLITAGSDIFLMPSLYEPCGLNQMYSLNYGTIPLVRKTGGLADTVKDYHEYYSEGNGISFNEPTPHALLLTIKRALDLYKSKKQWREMIKRGMQADFSWENSAKAYLEIYKEIKK